MPQKTARKTVGARIIEGLEELAEALERKQPLGEKFTCRKVTLDLAPSAYSPELVQHTRKLLRCSQAVFAMFLGVSVRTVRAWEQGTNTPSDLACRFMDEIRRDPQHWMLRLTKAIVSKS